MKMYASCPKCGYKLCKSESGSDADILCPRCGKLVRVVITETNTTCPPEKAAKELNGSIAPPVAINGGTFYLSSECMKKRGAKFYIMVYCL